MSFRADPWTQAVPWAGPTMAQCCEPTVDAGRCPRQQRPRSEAKVTAGPVAPTLWLAIVSLEAGRHRGSRPATLKACDIPIEKFLAFELLMNDPFNM